MSFLDLLAKASVSTTSVWHQFALAHTPNRDEWYIFVEGQLDTPFYTSALRPLIGTSAQIFDFRCDGKAGALTARDEIRRTHPNCKRALFFIDKDLDDFVQSPRSHDDSVFCTDLYSIENYFVSDESLSVVWTQLWSLSPSDPTWQIVQEQYADAMREFHRLLTPVMAWAILARRASKRPNLNNLRMNQIVSVEDCVPRLRQDALSVIKRVTSCDHAPDLREWIQLSRRLTKLPASRYLRGKFEIWMFANFLHGVCGALSSRPSRRPPKTIPLTPDGLAISLVGKISVPAALDTFLAGAVARGSSDHTCPIQTLHSESTTAHACDLD